MRRKTGMAFFALAGLMAAKSAKAQDIRPVTFDLNTDFRSRIASSGTSRANLYNNQVGIHAKMGAGLRFNYTGAQINAPNLTGMGARWNRFITQDATLEKEWKSQRLQGGIVRIPFGLSDHRETYISGLIDYPLTRGDYALSSVDWGVPGVRWTGGSPNLQIDGAVFGGQASGLWNNLNNVQGAAVRAQTYTHGVVMGLSYWNGSQSTSFSRNGPQNTQMTGLDLRYTRPHLLIRGEYMLGRLAGDTMRGWYLDMYYHLPKFEKWTLTARLEQLKPSSDDPTAHQITLGVRYTLDKSWILAVNWRHNNGSVGYSPTWTPAAVHGGDVFFQLYRKTSF